MQLNTKNSCVMMTRSVKIFYPKNLLKYTIIGAGNARFDYRAGQIGYSVVNGFPPLRCFFGAELSRR